MLRCSKCLAEDGIDFTRDPESSYERDLWPSALKITQPFATAQSKSVFRLLI
jgi:hypothetical protein